MYLCRLLAQHFQVFVGQFGRGSGPTGGKQGFLLDAGL